MATRNALAMLPSFETRRYATLLRTRLRILFIG
jgi:hypothetical protein